VSFEYALMRSDVYATRRAWHSVRRQQLAQEEEEEAAVEQLLVLHTYATYIQIYI
jgi:hypothetical protein